MSVTTVEAPPVEARELPPLNQPKRRPTRFVLPAYSILMMFYLASPIFVMIAYSFNDVPLERQQAKFFGLTTAWWRNLFDFPNLTSSIEHSFSIAIPTAIIATIIGTLLGLALGRYRFRGQGGIMFVIFLAIAVPEIVMGSSLLTLFIEVQTPSLGFATLLLAHVTFCIAFVAVTVRARVQGMDRSLEDAAQDLFASPVVAFFKVTLPLILPGIVAGGLLAFVLSLDDFVISNFVYGNYETFPIWVWGTTKIGIPPQVNVMGTILFVTGIVLAVLSVLAQRRRT